MPLYDFRCETCGLFEQSRSIQQASDPMFCPTCQSAAKRLISAVGVLKTPTKLSKRIEQSAEPRIVQRTTQHNHSTHQHNHHRGRPWTVGH